MRRMLTIMLALGLFAGCTGAGQPEADDREGTALDVTHVWVQDTTHDEEGIHMIRTGDGDQVRLEVYAGKRPTGGYSVTIEEVRRVDDTIIVDAVVGTPEPGSVVTQAFTYPADAVTFPLEPGAYRVQLRLAEGNTTRTTERTAVIR